MSSAGGARLQGLTRELMHKWVETRNSWRDTKALEFEKKFMDELEFSANHAATGIENLERIIRNIRNDCE